MALMPHPASKFLNPGVLAVLNRLAAAAAGFAVTTVFARILSFQQFGAMSGAIAYVNVAIVLGMLGQEQWSTRQAVVAPGSRRYLRFLYRVVLPWALVVAVVVALLLMFFQSRLLAFVGLLLVAPVVGMTRIEQGLLRGYGVGEWAGLPDGLIRPVLTLIVALAASRVVSTDRLPAAIILGWVVAALTALVLVQPLRRRLQAKVAVADQADGANVHYSGSAFLSSLLSVATNQVPMISVAMFAAPEEMAMYAGADRFGMLVAMLPQAIYQARAGSLAAAHRDGGRDGLAREFMRVTRSGWKIAIPVSLLVFGLAPWLLSAFGRNFEAAVWVLRIGSLATLVSALAGPLGMALIMSGHARANSVGMSVGVVLQLALSMLLVPRWGALGAATGVLCSTTAWVLLLMLSYRFALGHLPYQRSPA